MGDLGNGVLVLTMALIAGFGGLGAGKGRDHDGRGAPGERCVAAAMRLFVPALIIPLVTVVGTILIKGIELPGLALGPWSLIAPYFETKQATLISLAVGAFAATHRCARDVPAAACQSVSRRPAIDGRDRLGRPLPQMLASLGAVFAVAGVGKVVGDIAAQWVPADSLFVAVAVYCVGMAAFTMIMGNAFAAFPVLTAGVGIPFLIQRFGGEPAAVAAIGMLAGFCGTLMTPLGRELQHRAGGVARTEEPQRRDPRADTDRADDARDQHDADVRARVSHDDAIYEVLHRREFAERVYI